MDLNYSSEELAFRDEVRGWLAKNLPRELKQKVEDYEHLSKEDLLRWHHILADKGWIAPACDQLLRLRKKLDFANAATTELDVVPFDCDFTVTTIGIDLTFHGMDVGECDVVEVLSPHKRCQLVKNCFPRCDIAGARDYLRANPATALEIENKIRAAKGVVMRGADPTPDA